MHLWLKDKAKVDKHDEVCKSVMADMMTLASLFLHFQQQEMSKTQAQRIWVVMFRREDWSALLEAVRSMTT